MKQAKKEDTVGNCHVNQCPPVHSAILDIVYQCPPVHSDNATVKISIIRTPTNPTGTVNSHICSHSSAVHNVF